MSKPLTPREIERYFPRRFSELAGNSALVEWARCSLTNGFSNTLITGPKGSGKTRLVLLAIKAALCPERGQGIDPCGYCSSCLKIGEAREEHWGLFSAMSNSNGCMFPIDCENVTGATLRDIQCDARFEGTTTYVLLDEACGLGRRGLERGLLKPIDESNCVWIATAIAVLPHGQPAKRPIETGLLPETRRRFSMKINTSLPSAATLRVWIPQRCSDWEIEIVDPDKTVPFLIQRAEHLVGAVQSVLAVAALYGRRLTYELVRDFNFEPLA